ncbi:MAG: hypothetical protein WC476_12180 [Phycisphaerae bacterium]|jgi:hypothetical protein
MTFAKRFEAGLNNFTNPFLETIQPFKTKDVIIGLIIFPAVFAVFASLGTEALSNGDAVVYLQQMQNLNFNARAVHLGYYLLGAGFIRILPGSNDYAINLMNCFLGALSIMLVYFITFTICHKRIPAIAASILLFTHYMFLENSIYAEVYTPQVCFFLLSILLWLLNKPILASLSFLLSFLITPSAILALPCFFILRPRLRPLLLFCVVFLVLAVAAVFPFRQSYFFGSRGLFEAVNRPFSLNWALNKEGREIFSSFFLCIPLVVAGLLEIFGRKQFRPFAFALLVLWLVTLFFAEKIRDVSPQLPLYTMLCVVGGLGLGLLLRISNNKAYIKFIVYAVVIAVIFAVFINGLNAFKGIRILVKGNTAYRNAVIQISKVAEPDCLVIGNWNQVTLFEHYLFRESFKPNLINVECIAGLYGGEQREQSVEMFKQAGIAGRQMWLLEAYPVLLEGLKQHGYKVSRFDFGQLDPEGLLSIYAANAKEK